MPTVAGWVDEMREAFGVDCVNRAIRNGMKGAPTFHARENGHEIGTPLLAAAYSIGVSEMVLVKQEERERNARFK